MAFNELAANRQSHAGALIFATTMQALEQLEDLLQDFFLFRASYTIQPERCKYKIGESLGFYSILVRFLMYNHN